MMTSCTLSLTKQSSMARVRRGGADAIELVDGKTALVSLSPFSFAQPLRATTELDLPDPNSMVELHKGFPGPDRDLAQFDDFVGGCFCVNIESDPRALATWANLTRGFFLALDVAGVIEDPPEYKAVAAAAKSFNAVQGLEGLPASPATESVFGFDASVHPRCRSRGAELSGPAIAGSRTSSILSKPGRGDRGSVQCKRRTGERPER